MDLFLAHLERPVSVLDYAPPPSRTFHETVHVQAAKFVLSLTQSAFEERFIDTEFREWQCRTKADARGHFNAVRALCAALVESGGAHRPSYKYGRGSKCGRIYVDGVGGVQRVSLKLRDMLVTPDMVDHDMVNAHPTILLWVYQSLGLNAQFLKEYVNDRAAILAQTGKTKRDFLTMINKDYNKAKNEPEWVGGFIRELKTNKQAIHAIIADGYATANRTNPLSSVINKFLCDIENRLLQGAIDAFGLATGDDRKVVPMYDGFMTNQPVDLAALNAHTAELGVTWKVKAWTQAAVPAFDERKGQDYASVKARFEEHFYTVRTPHMYFAYEVERTRTQFIDLAGTYQYVPAPSEASPNGLMRPTPIFLRWLGDPYHREYERYDWQPFNPLEEDPTPPEVLNEAAPMAFSYIPAAERDATALPLFTQILEHLCPEEEARTYTLQWYAHIVQRPRENPQTVIVFKGHAGGVGKDTGFLTMTKLLGAHHTYNTADMDKIFGKNNPGLDKALLVNFNEARGKDGCRHFDAVKNLATQKSNVISNKYIADKTQPNYARLAFNSNNPSPIPPERRLVVNQTRVDEILPKEWFDAYYEKLNDPRWVNSLGSELMDVDLSGFKVGRAPTTAAKQDKLLDCIKPVHQFLQKLAEGAYDSAAEVQEADGGRLAVPFQWLLSEYHLYLSGRAKFPPDRASAKKDLEIWTTEYGRAITLRGVPRIGGKQVRRTTIDREVLIRSLKNGGRYTEKDMWEYV